MECFKTEFPVTIVSMLMVVGPAKTVRLQVNMGTQRERPLWESFTISKKPDSSYTLSCVTERSPEFWSDLSGAFNDPLNDLCAGNADICVETRRSSKRGVHGEARRTYSYTFSFQDSSNVGKLVHLVAGRFAFEAEVCRGGGGSALVKVAGGGDGKIEIGQSG